MHADLPGLPHELIARFNDYFVDPFTGNIFVRPVRNLPHSRAISHVKIFDWRWATAARRHARTPAARRRAPTPPLTLSLHTHTLGTTPTYTAQGPYVNGTGALPPLPVSVPTLEPRIQPRVRRRRAGRRPPPGGIHHLTS